MLFNYSGLKMVQSKFILSKSKLKKQIKLLENLGLKVSYSYKTNREVGKVLTQIPSCKKIDFSVHAKEEIKDFSDMNKIWFFTQAENIEELTQLIEKGIKKFVVDNEVDLERLMNAVKKTNKNIWLSLRMKFKEHRIGSGKYFVYGMSSKKVNEIIEKIHEKENIEKIGIHIHRKSQNTNEWAIREELEDSIEQENLDRMDFVNFGGGLPIKYRGYTSNILEYIFTQIKNAKEWLNKFGIESYIEPGRFIAGPAIKLETEIIQKYNNNLIINTTIYNCALDTHLTETKMLIEEEYKLEKEDTQNTEEFLVKGNSPTRDDIFRYRVNLPKNIGVGDKITFINAGAYNYTTDFFGYKKLPTEIIE